MRDGIAAAALLLGLIVGVWIGWRFYDPIDEVIWTRFRWFHHVTPPAPPPPFMAPDPSILPPGFEVEPLIGYDGKPAKGPE